MELLGDVARRVGALTNLVLALVLGAVLAGETAWTATHHGNWEFELAIGAVMSGLALVRGRYRLWAAAAGLALCGVTAVVAELAHLPSQPSFAASAALLVLGAACARSAAARPASLVAGAGIVVMVAGRVTAKPADGAAAIFFGVLLWAGAFGTGLWLRTLDTQRLGAIDAARQDERLQLARELHDVVAHHITGIVLQAQAGRLVASKRPETVEGTLAGIESASTDALVAMRRVVGLLRQPDDAGGRTSVPEPLGALVSRFADRCADHGPTVEVHLPAGPVEPSWPPEVTTTVYRVVQEALTNVACHAPSARAVTVTVEEALAGVTVEVTDDGLASPYRSGPVGGYGLIGMRERVEALGGQLRAGPRPPGGWEVHAIVPLQPDRAT